MVDKGSHNGYFPIMKLNEWRLANNLSMEELASKIDVSGRMTVYRYEQGRMPDPEILKRIIDVTEGAVTANDWFDVPAAQSQQKGAA